MVQCSAKEEPTMSRGKPRDPRKERFWRRMVQQWQRSGLSVRAFCEQHDLSPPSFYAWRRTLADRDAQAIAFVPVEVSPPPAGIFGEAGHADYAAAKAGLIYGLARSLKNEICRLAPRGRVNVVAPGWTLTPLTTTFSSDPERVRRTLQTIPLRKVG